MMRETGLILRFGLVVQMRRLRATFGEFVCMRTRRLLL